MIYFLPIENNVFDSLYYRILLYDNDLFDHNARYFSRELLIQCFIKMMDDVYHYKKKSIYYHHYELSNSIDSFFRTIIKPRFQSSILNQSSIIHYDTDLFSYYTDASWDEILSKEEKLFHYCYFHPPNDYSHKYGMFEISSKGDVTPFFIPNDILLSF